MSDRKSTVECAYCGAAYTVVFPADVEGPTFCAFCSEYLATDAVESELDESDEEDDRSTDGEY